VVSTPVTFDYPLPNDQVHGNGVFFAWGTLDSGFYPQSPPGHTSECVVTWGTAGAFRDGVDLGSPANGGWAYVFNAVPADGTTPLTLTFYYTDFLGPLQSQSVSPFCCVN
jgi:hypothetical protein